MPRPLLRDRQVVDDDWRYADEAADDPSAAVIVEYDAFVNDKAAWLARGTRLGVILSPQHEVERIVADLPNLSLVASRFPGPADGRGYTHARLLRERYGFTGEVRAIGYVRPDQVFFLSRCGFNSLEVKDDDLAVAASKFDTFTAAYQTANDVGLAHALKRELAPTA